MELIEKTVYLDQDSELDVFYQPIASFELGNFRALRELLTVDEINKYCGEKEMSGEEVERLLFGIISYCDYRAELTWQFLTDVLNYTFSPENEIRSIIVKITWY
jgi:hypothetical protein